MAPSAVCAHDKRCSSSFHDPIEQLAVNTLRSLSIDASYKAKSGHPGAPLGMAPMVHVAFRKMRFDPRGDKEWINRDRFVLSNGHACSLLYATLHLFGYDISMDDLKSFRKLGSKTPGHPEVDITPGVEVTTGPLGQGFANAVGLAIAQVHMAAVYNRPDCKLFDNKTIVTFGDGCAMEGVACEAASLAGHLRLGNLIALYDDNHVCIDGNINSTLTEDVSKRFEAYGWHVQHVINGDHDLNTISDAIDTAMLVTDRPSMIKVTTTIGFGSRHQGTAASHGSPLKIDDIKQLKDALKISPEPFHVPDSVYKLYRKHAAKGTLARAQWQETLNAYAQVYPHEYMELSRRFIGELPQNWEKKLLTYTINEQAIASRKLSEMLLSNLQGTLPELMSGSADLTSSNLTRWKSATDFQSPKSDLGNHDGRYLRWGVREHAMGAAMNGIAAYGANLIPCGGTFLNFLPYAAGAIRLAALSGHRVIWIATHDSIALGEDGPTHQPIETLAYFRAMPNIHVWRPADGNETSAAYKMALTRHYGPAIIALTRQDLPQLATSSIDNAARGGYVCHEDDAAAITLVSSGSEVDLCMQTSELLREKHQIRTRVVSMPCFEVFDTQCREYRLKVLRAGIPILSVEAGSTQGWERYSHAQLGIDRFGASGSCADLFELFELTPVGVSRRAVQVIDFHRRDRTLRSPIERPF